MEIHGSRAVEFQDLSNELFFRVRMLPRSYVRFCKIGSMERQKIITFKKSLSKNMYLLRRYVIFKNKKCEISSINPGHFQREINEN